MIIVGIIMSIIFGLLAIVFQIFKEDACVLISGYNFKSKKERKEYDELRLSKDERNFFFICAIIYLIGTVLSIFEGRICFWIAFVVWLVYFFENVHLSSEKAFNKYKRKV